MPEETQEATTTAAQTPPEDLRRNALDHYEKVTTVAHEWYSVIPKAINAYFDALAAAPATAPGGEREPACPFEPGSENYWETPAATEAGGQERDG